MSKPDAFATIRRARSLRERHPDAPPSVCAVALVMATYADGSWGTNIRPGNGRIIEQTGLGRTAVREAIRWMENHSELRCDKLGRRGSAACYTFLGVGDMGRSAAPIEDMGRSAVVVGRSPAPTNPTSPTPSGPDGPPGGGKRCRKHPAVELYEGTCWECDQEAYWAKHGGAPS